MKPIYQQIWKLAKPYYKKGRPMDIDHIEWMMKDALLVCKKENLDDTLLLPLVILHDVGYAEVPKDNPYNLDLRKAHMKAGKKIAKEILEKVNYPKDKIKTISYYVSVHDNWALGNNKIYQKDVILGTFTDLDFIWMTTKKGFPAISKILKKNKKEMVQYIENNEKLVERPFATKTVKELFQKYLQQRKKAL
ncbi:hypothetical protein HON71_02625 [Candidatus Woesearchaeota archaeon]|jgi:hypothetical protein|nr:hypothetical protein [Candidatus Woesearchaeota archaeon]MBT5341959.1 hypothetical protein [Candidatus Woesearchaeota archaeon]